MYLPKGSESRREQSSPNVGTYTSPIRWGFISHLLLTGMAPRFLKQRACDLFGDGSRLVLEQLPRRGRILSNRGAYRDDEQPVADSPYHLLTARVTHIGRARHRLISYSFQGDRDRRA